MLANWNENKNRLICAEIFFSTQNGRTDWLCLASPPRKFLQRRLGFLFFFYRYATFTFLLPVPVIAIGFSMSVLYVLLQTSVLFKFDSNYSWSLLLWKVSKIASSFLEILLSPYLRAKIKIWSWSIYSPKKKDNRNNKTRLEKAH